MRDKYFLKNVIIRHYFFLLCIVFGGVSSEPLFVDLLLKTSTKIDINCRAKGIRLAIKTHSILSSRNWVDLA